MTARLLQRWPVDSRAGLLTIIEARVDLRFDVTAAGLADHVAELAAVAGVRPVDHAVRIALSDLYLATACEANDNRAWVECEARYFGFIRSFARRFLPDAAARDLADQIIADLWQRRKIGRFAGRSTLKTWLGAVVAHAAINARTASAGVVALEAAGLRGYDGRPPRPNGPEDADTGRVLSDLVTRAVAGLRPDEKLLLQLYYEQGLTLDQMERAVHTSKATLSRRLKKIRENLKEAVDDLAGRSYGVSAASLRERLALDRLELDLSCLLTSPEAVEGK